MSSLKPLTILHLSDLQFGRNHRFGRMSSSAPDDSFETLVGRLQQDLIILQSKHDLRPDLLVVTGDLAEWGKRAEFEDVFTFLDRMAGFLGLERDRVLVVPGNHDINRSACEAYFANCKADDETPREPFWPKFRHYVGFFERFYEGLTAIRFTEAVPWTLFEIKSLRVVVAGLDSAMKESHRDEDHYGWVGERQLRWFAGELRKYKEQGWMRIGLVHHNVQRRAMEDEENLRDVDALVRILGGELNLLLHGHTHEGRLHWLGPRLPVLSTGSASVVLEARPKEVPNQYQVIRLHADRLWYGTRQYAPDQQRWIGDTRSSSDGDQWFHEEQVPFEHVGGTFGQASSAEVVRTDQLATVVASYRSHVATTFRRQLLHDLCTRAEDQDIPGGLALLDIFIPQAVNAAPPRKDLPQGWEGVGEDVAVPWEEGTSSISVEQALFDPKRSWAVLLGAPGAGKTSLTRWFCLKLCVPGESLPGLSSELVPVRVEMRRFDERYRAATANGRVYDFFDYLDQEHAEKALPLRGESLRALWTSGRLVWLFDGMDEVSDVPSRQRYAEMIIGLRKAGAARGVITSRIVGAQPILPYFQSEEGIGIYTLLDFDDARIQEFLARWHEKAFPGSPEAGASRRERLERVIAESRPVRDLCRNPLLLTLIALLNRGGELPRRRHLLYRRAVELMAAQWEANKQLPVKAEILQEPEERIAFLRELAWWMMFEQSDGSRNLVREEDLLRFTSRFLVKHYGKGPDQARRLADALIGHLRERNYILARVGESLFGFVHKAFLEYLVAEAIRSRFAGREIELGWIEGLFQRSWSKDAWREILTLVCGMLEEDRPTHVMNVLQAILSGIDVYSFTSMQFGGFAVSCLAEVRQLDQEPLRTFMGRLADFLQYQMSDSPEDFADASFSVSIHRIGPRWPERERWSRWALARELGSPSARVMANRCAIGTTPIEEQEALLINLLADEKSDFVVADALACVHLSKERIQALLGGTGGYGEGVRCAIACGLAVSADVFNFYGVPGDLLEAALQTLNELLENSHDPKIRLRAALGIMGPQPTALAQDLVIKHLRTAQRPDEDLLACIHALAPLTRKEPTITSELMSLLPRFSDWIVHMPVADTLVRAGRVSESLDILFQWLAQVPEQEARKRVVEMLISWARTFQNVGHELARLRTEGVGETIRGIAALVCERLTPVRHEGDVFMMSFDEVLERLETTGVDAERLISGLFHNEIPESENDRVQRALRRAAAAEAHPRSRLAAARAMRNLSLVPEEESHGLLKELAGSSTDELVRLHAARLLGDEGRPAFESLAASATQEKVRTMAAFSLRSLELRASLQEVGQQPSEP
jgi:3',5'-cyclic AMP phosphodiesterase CpdA